MRIIPLGRNSSRRRVAVVGTGISGASAAWALRDIADVTLFEASHRAGGHTATVDIDYDGTHIAVDTGFIVYNERNYPELVELFAHLGVETHASDMGFSLSLDGGRVEWCGKNLRTIFAQKRNFFSPGFLWMLREILRFNRICVPDRDSGWVGHSTIGEYLRRRNFSEAFRENYLIPMAAAVWSTPRARMLEYPASALITFFDNHRLLHGDRARPVWRTVTGGARRYLDKMLHPVAGQLHLGAPARAITRDTAGVTVEAGSTPAQRFDDVIVATHSDQALAMLADATTIERKILSAIRYRPNRVILHRDPRLMPKRASAWAAWNYARSSCEGDDDDVCVTYWMNRLQGIDERYPLFVSLNPITEPREELTFGEWTFDHPQFDTRALSAQARLDDIQGAGGVRYAGAWIGHGFHEDGLRSGLEAAKALGAMIPWHANRAAEAPELALAAE